MGETDGPGVVRGFGMLQRPAVVGDGARLIATSECQPTVQPPERRQPQGGNGVAECVWRPAEDDSRLIEVVLKKPGLRQCRAHRELVLAWKRGGAQDRHQQLGSLGTATPLECSASAGQKRLK